MKRYGFRTILALLTASSMLIISLATIPINVVAEHTYEPPFLEGERINLLNYTYTLDSTDPCYVRHSYVLFYPWKEMTAQEKREFLSDEYTRIELWILNINEDEAQEVDLHKWLYRDIFGDMGFGEDQMRLSFYVQFESGHFAPGTYLFTGLCYSEGEIFLESSSTVTFN